MLIVCARVLFRYITLAFGSYNGAFLGEFLNPLIPLVKIYKKIQTSVGEILKI